MLLFRSALSLACLMLGFSCHRPPSEAKSPDQISAASVPEPLFPPFGPARTTSHPVLIEKVSIMSAVSPTIASGYVLLREGKIAALGAGEPGPDLQKDAEHVDGSGKFLTPGIIDTHSHMGVYPLPEVAAHEDGNEMTRPTTPDVWSEHSFWPQDPALWRALAAGVTAAQILPGSANLVGGRSVTIHLRPGIDVASMRFSGAPQGMKMACGENPKRTYGEKSGPATRMGNIAGFRRIFQDAIEYRETWDRYQKKLSKGGEDLVPPKRDHALDTLVKVLAGEILVHVHCYRADEMSLILDLAKTYGFKVRSFHHALEAYKVRDRLAAEGVAVSTWADWWGFKMEAFDGIPTNAALLEEAKVRPIMHSDSPEEIRHLNIEAVKARTAALRLGIEISDEVLLQWITKNPAWALGIDHLVGSLEVGKLADVVLWDRHPFSSYAKAEKVWIEGEKIFDRVDATVPASDLERGSRDKIGLGDRAGQLKAEPGAGIPPAHQGALAPALVSLPEGTDSYIVEHVRLENGKGASLLDASIWVEKGLIKAINPTAVPANVPRMDGGGRTLTPGLIETESQLGVVIIELEKQGQDHEGSADMNPAFRALDGLDPYSLRIPIAREQGITSALVKPSHGFIAGQGQLINLSMSSHAIEHAAAPVMFASILGGKNRGQFWLKIREAIADAQLFHKVGGGQLAAWSHQLSLSPLQLEALYEVLQGRMKLVLEVHRLADVEAALRLKAELAKQKIALPLILSGAGEAWLAASEIAAAGVPVILTPSDQMPKDLDQLRVRDDQAAVLRAAGVTVVISTRNIQSGRLRYEAARAVTYALPYEEALAAITSVPAQVFGWNDRGSLEVGKRADLVIWSDDPLEARSRVDGIWIGGQPLSLATRQSALAEAYHHKPQRSVPAVRD